MQKRRGFTTVELVIVIAVIAILATALIPTFGGLIKSANHNVDVQAANTLTSLVTMYSMKHEIASERDLADAINEGMGDPNYYANLKAKSARYGYCFWYDYNNYRVYVGTIEEMAKMNAEQLAVPSDWDITLSNERKANGFTKGLRADLVPGFILMGFGGGNDLMDLVINLETAEDAGAYADALAAINTASTNTTGAIQAAVTALKNIANTTVIHNENGVFAPSAADTVVNVHIPQGTATLSNDVVVVGGGELAISGSSVIIPTDTAITSGSLAYLSGECTINVNIPADKLPDNIELESTGAQIVVSSGEAYTQQTGKDENNQPLNMFVPVGGSVEDAISGVLDSDAVASLLASYVLGDNESNQNYVYIDTTKKIIYVSRDLKDAFEIVAGSFVDSKNETATHGIFTWSTSTDGSTYTELSNTGKAISIDSKVKNVNVKTLGVEYTYEVKVVEVTRFVVTKFGGIDYGRNLGYDADHATWGLTVEIGMTDGLTLDQITVDQTISIVNNPTNYFKLINTDKKGVATLSILTTVGEGESAKEELKLTDSKYNCSIKFACGGFNTEAMEISLIDSSKSAFDIISSVDTQTKYNFPFVVGTTGHTVTLKELFTPKSGVTVTGHVEVSTDNGNTWKEYTAAQWNAGIALNDFVADAAADGSLTLVMKLDGGTYDPSIALSLKVVDGAYNVAEYDDWEDAPNNTNIVLFNSITIDKAEHSEQYETTDSEGNKHKNVDFAGEGYTSKNIGSKTIYGNLKSITVKEYLIYSYSFNYLINTKGGKVDRLIVIGPDYRGMDTSITGDHAQNYGNYVAAVMASGNSTISNCFLSGFRSPVHATGSKSVITISNTTLHLGNYANLYVDNQVTLNINNVTTVQYSKKDAQGNITGYAGGGISYKHNAGATQVINATNLTQYNFLSEKEVQGVVDQAAAVAGKLGGALVSAECKDYALMGDVTHTINGTPYYHMGVTALNLNGSAYAQPTGLGSNFSAPIVITKNFGVADVTMYVWGLNGGSVNYSSDRCGVLHSLTCSCRSGWSYSCNHANSCQDKEIKCTNCSIGLPSTNDGYHLYEFLTLKQNIDSTNATTYVTALGKTTTK